MRSFVASYPVWMNAYESVENVWGVMPSTDVVEAVRERLHEVDDVGFFLNNDGIEIRPEVPGGFNVTLKRHRNGIEVAFGGAYKSGPLSSLDTWRFTGFGLSTVCRMRVSERGNARYKVSLECLSDGEWSEWSVCWDIFFPFWRSKSVTMYQNALIRPC